MNYYKKVILIERCLICHRKLNDPESIARKIGPTCFKRLMKVTKEQKEKRKAKEATIKLKNIKVKGQINMFEEE